MLVSRIRIVSSRRQPLASPTSCCYW